MGNPFTENSSDLIILDTREIADPAITERVRQIEKLGTDRYELCPGTPGRKDKKY